LPAGLRSPSEPLLKRTSSLYLDVWKPANATAGSALPVRVWIYGGANSAGGISDPLYDGCNIASGDALLVSINYRLGPLGFLALDSAGIAGNQATQDILLALEWVQENIAAFGGDPVSRCAETPPSCGLHVANVNGCRKRCCCMGSLLAPRTRLPSLHCPKLLV
jgi:hypothetical protein